MQLKYLYVLNQWCLYFAVKRVLMHSDGGDQCFQALLDPIPTSNLSISEPAVADDSTFCWYPHNKAQHRLQLAVRLSRERRRQARIGFRIHGDNLVCTPFSGLSVYSVSMDTDGGWDLHMCKAVDMPAAVGQGCQYQCQCSVACARILVSILDVNQKQEWRICDFTLSNYWFIKIANWGQYIW